MKANCSLRRLILFCSLALLTTPDLGLAEYRVFLLKISKKPKAAPTTETPITETQATEAPVDRIFPSTLDPEQYRGYYPVASDEIIQYIDTWMCRGRTDGKKLCPSPRQPANVTED